MHITKEQEPLYQEVSFKLFSLNKLKRKWGKLLNKLKFMIIHSILSRGLSRRINLPLNNLKNFKEIDLSMYL